ncbi:glycoside hydrolase family 135 protein [Periconia macrospinosa]|uniref:Glycoside hydrolase family 135 protein n=1 Tax=Periconia macrospinosa TaxID=97972 RepID=A0A2V1DEY8_9PLEO|nr:glycoside hydrolase family 135 protein [Periconia macrospinosa]
MALALLVAIVLPLAAFLPPKYVVALPVNVLVPLYINPEAGGWDRLVDSAIKHSSTNFTVILNPSNGPGSTAWPSGTYIAEIKKLNKLPNVATIGYIDVDDGQRANANVLKEIETYAGWNNSQIALSGIFFDHTPSLEWGDIVNGTAQEYLRNISATVKTLGGFDERRTVVFNPGKIPNANLSMSGVADITVVFEGAYNEMPAMEDVKGELSALQQTREGLAYWVHSVPGSAGRHGVRKVVDRTRRNFEWLFLSNRWGEDKYEGYGDGWEEFLDLTW